MSTFFRLVRPVSPAPTRSQPRVSPRSPQIWEPRELAATGACAPTVQAKLRLGDVADPLEREADSFADSVLSSSEPRRISDGAGGLVQRECHACQEEEEADVRRKPRDGSIGGPSLGPGFESGLAEARARGGRPLPGGVRDLMADRLPTDLGRVRIHDDVRSTALAREIGARAFTVGRDVFFDRGEYRPGTRQGMRLLAHELAHVAQQNEDAAHVRRVVKVGGASLPPVDSTDFREFIARHDLRRQAALLRSMHASAGVVEYETPEDCAFDVKVRQATIENMQTVEKREEAAYAKPKSRRAEAIRALCCAYGISYEERMTEDPHLAPTRRADPRPMYHLDKRYWTPELKWAPDIASNHSGIPHFTATPGARPSAAVKSVFRRSRADKTRLDCNAMLTAVHYKALLDVLGPEAFDSFLLGVKLREGLLTGEEPLEIRGFGPVKVQGGGSEKHLPEHALVRSGFYRRIDVVVPADDPLRNLLPGDRVYFLNHGVHKECNDLSVWLGEHALYLGDGKFTGYGAGSAVYYEEMLAKLLVKTQEACTGTDYQAATEAMTLQSIPGVINGVDGSKNRIAKVYRLSPEKIRAHLLKMRTELNP